MALIITGIFIQFLGLAIQFIQLRQGHPDDPEAQAPLPDAQRKAPGQSRRGEAAAADRDEANEQAFARSWRALTLKAKAPEDPPPARTPRRTRHGPG